MGIELGDGKDIGRLAIPQGNVHSSHRVRRAWRGRTAAGGNVLMTTTTLSVRITIVGNNPKKGGKTGAPAPFARNRINTRPTSHHAAILIGQEHIVPGY